MKDIYREIMGIQADKNISITELASSIGVKRQEITNMKNRGVDANIIAMFGVKHSVSIDWLLLGDEQNSLSEEIIFDILANDFKQICDKAKKRMRRLNYFPPGVTGREPVAVSSALSPSVSSKKQVKEKTK